MSTKITADHLGRIAVVYVRQSTMAQVIGNLESQRRQYDLAGAAKGAGFVSVTVIDDDLGPWDMILTCDRLENHSTRDPRTLPEQ